MKIAATLLLPSLLLCSAADAAEVEVGGTTLFRFEERSAPGVEKSTLAPAVQYLGVDAEKLADGNLSVHVYGWGRLDLADSSSGDGKKGGDLSQAYLQYRFRTAQGEVRLGRLSLSEPGVFEHLDGVSARADLALSGVSAHLFAGSPVGGSGNGDYRGDYLAGGRASYRNAARLFEAGLTVLREGGMEIPVPSQGGGSRDYRQEVALDLWFAPFKAAEVSGRTSYNTASGGLAKNSYRLAWQAARPVRVTLLYSDYELENYYAVTGIPSLFNPASDGSYSVYGAEGSWQLTPQWEATADYRRFDRDQTGTSDVGGGGLRLRLSERGISSGIFYHRSASAEDGINSYHELRGYCLYDRARLTASVEAIGQRYDNEIDREKSAYQATASLGWRIRPALALSGDLTVAANPRYDSEVKGVARLSWNYQTTGGAK